MREVIIYLFALLICSCSKTEEIMSSATTAVSISAQIGVDTRTNPLDETEAQRKVFNTGDEIAVSNGGVAVAYRNAGNTWSPSVEETFLKWEESTMNFTAHHPLNAFMNKFVTPLDQSTLENIAKADWMTATAMNQSQEAGAVNFTFQRKMAKVKVVISAFGDQYTPESAVSDVKILGISPYQVASVAGEGKQGSSYTVLVNPADVAGQSSFITLKVNTSHEEKVVAVPALNAAMSYTFNLRIGKDGMVLTPVSVEDWQSGEAINGNANETVVVVHNEADATDRTVNTLGASLEVTLGEGYVDIIQCVKITGTMNEADFESLMGFKEVDLSEVSIVGEIRISSVGEHWNGGNAIPFNAFAGLSSIKPNMIKKLVLPSSIEAIGEYAFRYCKNLQLNFGSLQNLKYLGMGAFNSCESLSGELLIPEQLSEIKSYAFQLCVNLTGSLTIPSNIKNIGSDAFGGCEGFTTLTLSDGVESIGYGAFRNCVNLTGSLTIPSNIKNIGSEAFGGCEGFTTLTLSEGVESIGYGAFRYCYDLTGTVIIPESVTSLGSQAFNYCRDITSFEVLWKASIPTVDGTVFPKEFKADGGEKQITIPSGTKADYVAFGWGAYNLVEIKDEL